MREPDPVLIARMTVWTAPSRVSNWQMPAEIASGTP